MDDGRAPGGSPGARSASGAAAPAVDGRAAPAAVDGRAAPGDRGSASPAPRPSAWDTAYQGTPSWETGRPQPAVLRLLDGGAFEGSVLDVGCGTGGHAACLARAGHRVVGLDIARAAIELARARAVGSGLEATFLVGDALDLASPARTLEGLFDTALDVGLFHVLQPADRRRYARALAAAVRPGGRAYVVAWSDRNPFGIGPARVSRRELRSSFRAAEGWRVEAIEETSLESNLPMRSVHAWLARLRRRDGAAPARREPGRAAGRAARPTSRRGSR